jgi:sn-glycerol 3-phosphate transport system substrate-binding protein
MFLALAACSDGGRSSSAGGDDAADACPVDALDGASGTIEVSFWHALDDEAEAALDAQVRRFNSEQSGVRVELVKWSDYEQVKRRWLAGLETGELPELALLEDTATQRMIDTRSVVPISSCIEADEFDTADFVGRVFDRYTVDDTLWPMPFNVSNPVLYYDQNAFTAAGLDPADPPTTLDAVMAASEKLRAAGYESGFGMKINPWYLEQWAAKADTLYVNHDNGRAGRATRATFDDETGRAAFRWMQEMADRGLARTNPDVGPNAFDNLLAIRSQVVGMTIDSSAALGTISQVLSSGDGGSVLLGVGPMPGPEGVGGVLVGGGALYVSKESSRQEIAATWKFVKFLVTPGTQAAFAAATGYVPIRKSSVNEQILIDRWNAEPGYHVAYDQLLSGKDDLATAGPVIGDYSAVRTVMRDAMITMLREGTDPDAALAEAAKDATAVIDAYNRRVSG